MMISKSKPISIIVACTQQYGISISDKLPWPELKTDMKYFKEITIGTRSSELYNAIIMGSNTAKSIGKVLTGRENIILSRTKQKNTSDYTYYSSFYEAYSILSLNKKIDNIFIIGGAELYRLVLKYPFCNRIYMTKIYKSYKCDKFFPIINEKEWHATEYSDMIMENGIVYQFITYTREILGVERQIYREEEGYLDLMRNIIFNGNDKKDRTGVGTLSSFGHQIVYNCRNSKLPLFTTKKVITRGIILELIMFIKGITDVTFLSSKGLNIWNGNTDRKFLDKIGLKDRQVGDMGPLYGFQWRHFGAIYKDCKTNYTECGIDQLRNAINLLKIDKDSRRIVISAWNPIDIPKMVLPPCHVLFQFYVNGDELSCELYQRSADFGLGVPWNVTSYCILLYVIAHLTNLKPAEFIHTIGDAHVYKNHVDKLMIQLERQTYEYPTIKIKESLTDIDNITADDIIIQNYNHHSAISLSLAI